MFPSRLLEKWWLRAFIALVIFFVWQLFYAINRVQSLEEERATLQATVSLFLCFNCFSVTKMSLLSKFQ